MTAFLSGLSKCRRRTRHSNKGHKLTMESEFAEEQLMSVYGITASWRVRNQSNYMNDGKLREDRTKYI